VADEECFTGSVDELGSEGVEVVEGLDAGDLGDEPVDEAKVPTGDANDRRDSGGVSDWVTGRGAGGEAFVQDGGEFIGCQGPVFVGEADTAVELGVAGESFLDAGHPDEDDAEVVSVEVVAYLFEAGGLEAVGVIDDDELGAAAGAGFGVDVGVNDAVLGVVDGEGDLLAGSRKPGVDLPDCCGDGRS